MNNTTKTSKQPVMPEAGTKPQVRLQSEVLFNGRQSLAIEHKGEVYVLRITKQGKLILTK
ncbi:MAG: hemin uptake protein HemP [Methylotenera sp.]|nr:hemin uptake protein HemP [Methylotenera sp.]